MNLSDDDFALFDLPRRHALVRAELDSRWRALQARVHPDRFAAEGAAAQRLAMQWAVRVNEAHQRLRDLEVTPAGGTAAQLASLWRADVERFARIARDAGLKPE